MQNLRGAWRTEDHSRTCVIQDSVTVIWTEKSARKRDLNGELERTRNPGKYSQ